MINVVMLVKDRPRLTHQAISSLIRNTDVDYNVTVIDDDSATETRDMLRIFSGRTNVALLRNETSRGITGQVRNLGVYWAEKYWGRGKWLYLSDNDVYFTPNWATKLAALAEGSEYRDYWLFGGQNHPYHQPLDTIRWELNEPIELREYGALAGTSWLMRWETWDRFSPLDAHAAGICQSEDHKFCQQIREAGGKVGAVWPHVVYDCGLTNTDGKPAVGAEAKQRVDGVLYE